jgi:hypothetical protein
MIAFQTDAQFVQDTAVLFGIKPSNQGDGRGVEFFDGIDIVPDTKIIAFRFCVLQSRKIREKKGEDNYNNVHMQIIVLVA